MYLLSPRLCFFIVIKLDLFVDREDSLMIMTKRIVMRTEKPAKSYTTSVKEGKVASVKLVLAPQ